MTDQRGRLEAANPAWVPLQAAPFNFLRSYELGSWHELEPSLTVQDSLVQSGISAGWDSKTGIVAIHPPWVDHPIEVYLFRSVDEFVQQLNVSGVPGHPSMVKLRKLATDLVIVSEGLINLFQNAVHKGRCRIFARPDSTFANFQLIPVDVWQNVTITDWGAGTAISAAGDTLFSIHASVDEGYTPSASAQALLRAVTPAGRNFIKWYLLAYAGKIGEVSQKVIGAQYRKDMEMQGLSYYGASPRSLKPLLATVRQIRALGLSKDDLTQVVNTTE